MKVAVKCNSILLDNALNIFLKPSLTSVKHCDFVVTDGKIKCEKPLFIIGKHIKKPFSKEELLSTLADFSQKENPKVSKENGILEKKIEDLTKKFSQDLVNLIKDYYEK